MGKLIHIIILAICFTCCSNTRPKYKKISTFSNIDEYVIDSILIDSTKTLSNSMSLYSSCSQCSKERLITINQNLNLLFCFNLKTQKREWVKKLEDVGIIPKHGLVNEIFYHKEDSIFIKQEYAISIIDSNGIKFFTSINSEDQKVKEKRIYNNNGYSEIHYEPTNKRIYFSAYSFESGITEKEFYDYSIESYYDMNSKQIINIPITYHKLYFKRFYGNLIQVTRAFNKDKILYGYPITEEIIEYDVNNRTTTLIESEKSNLDLKNTKPFKVKNANDFELKMRHMIASQSYEKLLYDDNRNFYYRFYSPHIPLKNDDGSYNSYGDKPNTVIIYDKDFNRVTELNLKRRKYSSSNTFVMKRGLAIGKNHYKNNDYDSNTISYDIIKFPN